MRRRHTLAPRIKAAQAKEEQDVDAFLNNHPDYELIKKVHPPTANALR